jgi:hypothetical protein
LALAAEASRLLVLSWHFAQVTVVGAPTFFAVTA